MPTTPKKTSAKSKKLPPKGQNIRLSYEAWQKISDYCQKEDIVMGRFVEKTVLTEIERRESFKK